MIYHFQDHVWPGEQNRGLVAYDIRLAYQPQLLAHQTVRLTGWRRSGSRLWRPIGPTMPTGLWRYLRPHLVHNCKKCFRGWHTGPGAKLTWRDAHSLRRGSTLGTYGVVHAPLIEIEVAKSIGFYGAEADQVRRLRACHKTMQRCPLPAVCSIPTADDFFQMVKKRNQTRVYPFQAIDGWHLRGHSRIVVDTPERREVTVSMSHEDGPAHITRWQSGDRWGGIKGVVTRAWVSNLWGLEYALFVIDTCTDPLSLYPRFRGNQFTRQTLAIALNRAKGYAANLRQIKHRGPRVWDLI